MAWRWVLFFLLPFFSIRSNYLGRGKKSRGCRGAKLSVSVNVTLARYSTVFYSTVHSRHAEDFCKILQIPHSQVNQSNQIDGIYIYEVPIIALADYSDDNSHVLSATIIERGRTFP